MSSREDRLYMDIAARLALQSYSMRHKVGAVIVKDGSIIAEGWNGTPSGWDNLCEDHILTDDPTEKVKTVTKREVLHAESNALMKVAKSTQSSKGATLYTILSPCFDCAKLIVQAGIIRVVYREDYRDLSPLDFLSKCDVHCEKLINERNLFVGRKIQTSDNLGLYSG